MKAEVETSKIYGVRRSWGVAFNGYRGYFEVVKIALNKWLYNSVLKLLVLYF